MSEEKAIATKSNIKHQRQITYNVFLAVYLFYDSSVRFGLTLSIEFVTLDFASKVFALHVHKKRVCCLLTVYALAKKDTFNTGFAKSGLPIQMKRVIFFSFHRRLTDFSISF